MTSDPIISLSAAAEILNVSEQYAAGLIASGKLVSTSRATKQLIIFLSDILDYKTQKDKERREAMIELVQLTEEYGGYDWDDETQVDINVFDLDRDRLIDDVRD